MCPERRDVGANNPPGSGGALGNARAFDVRSGAKLWEFSSVAQPGSVGHDTWQGDSWKGRFGANAWPFYFTLDEQRELLFLPLASPIPGGYGGDREGANLYGNSVVAVDAQTGAYKWHFQTIHHDVWDADPPAPPGLIDIVRNGRRVPAMALTTKSGYMYILNRETGQPIFGVEERSVPQSDVPGETNVSHAADSGEAAAAGSCCVQATGSRERRGHDTRTCSRVPGTGRTRWRRLQRGPVHAMEAPGGRSRNAGFARIPRRTRWTELGRNGLGSHVGVCICCDAGRRGAGLRSKGKAGAAVAYEKAAPGRGSFDVPIGNESWPCQKPPWGSLVAVNATTGDFAWRVPLGITEQLPAGKQNTGRPVLAGPIATGGGVLFVASTDDNRFRAFDSRTGRELWATRMERRGNANPITYQGRNGKQYVAVVATDTLRVFALP